MRVDVGDVAAGECAEFAERARRPSAWPAAQRQIGRGVPQYRSRDSAQSTLFSSQLPYRPCLMWSGNQLTPSFTASSRSFTSVVRTYQEVRA